MASKAVKWVALGVAETPVCETLEEPINCSGLDVVALPIDQTLRHFSYTCEFGLVATLYGLGSIATECGQIEHETAGRRLIPEGSTMLLPARGEPWASRQDVLHTLSAVRLLTHQ